MRILVFDNYDSFTYNLVHAVEKFTHKKVDVRRNDQVKLEDIEQYDKIILSPGPGIPKEAGLLMPLIETYHKTKSILGVCLGHQAIGECFGGTLVNLSTVYHGVSGMITIDNHSPSPLFKDLPEQIEVGRYHSWIVSTENFPAELDITARDENNFIMALQHRQYDIQGVQFHPESILTPEGDRIIKNWLSR